MARFHLVRKAAGRLRDNFKAADYGVNGARVGPKRLVVKLRHELGGKIDMVLDVSQARRSVRRHR